MPDSEWRQSPDGSWWMRGEDGQWRPGDDDEPPPVKPVDGDRSIGLPADAPAESPKAEDPIVPSRPVAPKRKRWRITVATVATLVAAAVAAIIVVAVSSSAHANDIARVVAAVQSDLKSSDSEAAASDLAALKSLDPSNGQIKALSEQVGSLALFAKGNSEYQKGDYSDAVDDLGGVPKSDTSRYPKAVKIIAAIRSKFLATTKAKIKSAFDQKRYADAVNAANVYLAIFQGDKDITPLLASANKKIEEVAAAKAAAAKKRQDDAAARLSKEYDEFQDQTFYEPAGYPRYSNENAIYPYTSGDPRNGGIHVKIYYQGSDWIFWDTATFLVGSHHIVVTTEDFDKTTDVVFGGGVYEDLDIYVDDDATGDEDMSTADFGLIATAKSVQVQLKGKYTYTRYLSASELAAFATVWQATGH